MNEKTPNKTHDDEDAFSAEENILALLSDLQHYTISIQQTAEKTNEAIRRFRVSVHGEDVDNYE